MTVKENRNRLRVQITRNKHLTHSSKGHLSSTTFRDNRLKFEHSSSPILSQHTIANPVKQAFDIAIGEDNKLD